MLLVCQASINHIVNDLFIPYILSLWCPMCICFKKQKIIGFFLFLQNSILEPDNLNIGMLLNIISKNIRCCFLHLIIVTSNIFRVYTYLAWRQNKYIIYPLSRKLLLCSNLLAAIKSESLFIKIRVSAILFSAL